MNATSDFHPRRKGHIMHLASRVLSLALLCLGLAACFTSKEPLIGAADAAFPFERIVFAEVSRADDRQTWTRKGDAYSWRPDENDEREAVMRLKAVGDNLYVVQMEFTEAGSAKAALCPLEGRRAGEAGLFLRRDQARCVRGAARGSAFATRPSASRISTPMSPMRKA